MGDTDWPFLFFPLLIPKSSPRSSPTSAPFCLLQVIYFSQLVTDLCNHSETLCIRVSISCEYVHVALQESCLFSQEQAHCCAKIGNSVPVLLEEDFTLPFAAQRVTSSHVGR